MGDALTGQDYALAIPDFYENVNPYIADQAAFSKFMAKYKDKYELTEAEQAEVLVALGFVEFAPEWLTPRANSIVDKYYPGLRKKIKFGLIINEKNNYFDGYNSNYALAVAAEAAGGLLLISGALLSGVTIYEFSKLIAALSGRIPAISVEVQVGNLTPEAAKSISNDKDKACAKTDTGCVAPKIKVENGNGKFKPCTTVTGKVAYPEITYALDHFDQVPPSKPHYPYTGSHYHLWITRQNPANGFCFWNKTDSEQLPPGTWPEREEFVN